MSLIRKKPNAYGEYSSNDEEDDPKEVTAFAVS
jgi:hypothetical protein